ncbi:MAG TPA: CPBP family intramembrane glutamic endopeptidase [Vicinamibacterales bacterium]|nr:CPBP family intramembrane glutamic endopeptidase [Vicinamibacterales bacterium]
MADDLRSSSSRLGALWRGHAFLFDKPPARPAYGEAAGRRLLLIVIGLEALRLARARLELAYLPLWLEMVVYLGLAVAAVRVAGVRWSDVGFNRWVNWNATEKSYLVQVVILLNIVFVVLFGDRLRAALADPSVVWRIFIPYFIFGFYQEVIYRGMLQTELVRRWGAVRGILASNALFTFGPLHYAYFWSGVSVAVPMLAGIFAIGLVFAMVFHRTANVWIAGTMHAFGNAYAVGTFSAIR